MTWEPVPNQKMAAEGWRTRTGTLADAAVGDWFAWDGERTAEHLRHVEVLPDRVVFMTWDGRGYKWTDRRQRVRIFRTVSKGIK